MKLTKKENQEDQYLTLNTESFEKVLKEIENPREPNEKMIRIFEEVLKKR